MNLYYELLKRPVFSMEDVLAHYGAVSSAHASVKKLINEGMVARIRRNLYTCISGETGAPIANRFQIASSITGTSFISHHTAMEYYGVSDQVFYEVYVGSETEFKSFEFDGLTYRFVKPKICGGVDAPQLSGGVRVTDKERTIVDCIKDMDWIAGPEEVIANIESVKRVNEDRLMKYLEKYENHFLYQKTGYILERYLKEELSDSFFAECKEKAGKSTRYLSSDYKKGTFVSEWNLVVPEMLFRAKNGGTIDADI